MISFFRSPVRNPHPECQMNTSQVYSYITNPMMAEPMTSELRRISDHDTRRHYKSTMFDYATFSGQFTYRSSSNFVQHTGLFCFDFDHIELQMQYDLLRTLLIDDPLLRTILLFRSPSGDGMKWVVESPVYEPLGLSMNNYVRKADVVKNHKDIYSNLAKYIELTYKVKPDATSDVSRACYLPYDPDCFHQFPLGLPQPKNYEAILEKINDGQQFSTPSATLVPLKLGDNRSNPNGHPDIRTNGQADNYTKIESLVERIERRHTDITSDYNQWVKIGFAIASAVGAIGSSLFHRISQYHPRYDYDQTERLYKSCLRNANGTVTLGTLVYLVSSE